MHWLTELAVWTAGALAFLGVCYAVVCWIDPCDVLDVFADDDDSHPCY